MSRLYANTAIIADIAGHFGAAMQDDTTVPSETVEGDPGLVVVEDRASRKLRTMTWGFPRLTLEMGLRGDEPTRVGLVADLTNPMWQRIVVDPRHRCLIPLTHFANPDGDPGAKTRTWFSVEGAPIVAWAGFHAETKEFGPVFAGMTMTANERVMPYNDRMPTLLAPSEYDRWLHGSIQDVIGYQFRRPLPDSRTVIQSTEDRWRSGRPPASNSPQLALL